MQCVKTVSYSFIFNGVPTEPFPAAKGLKQGDPISPFLFAIAMEYLSRGLDALIHDQNYKFHPKCKKLGITHLSFADDLQLLARGDLPSIEAMQKVFTQFSKDSGLQANLNKSSIHMGGVSSDQKELIIQQCGYVKGDLPFKYLGIPLATKKLSVLQWQTLIDKIVARISNWTAKKLSYPGRLQLVQTLIFGIQSYWAQLFVIPSKVLKLIDAYCRSYVWSGGNVITRKALEAWERLCSPKSCGGLNLTNLQLWNRAALAKHFWDITNKKDKLWVKWMHMFYIKNQMFYDCPSPKQASWMIRKVMDAKSILQNADSGQPSTWYYQTTIPITYW
ncbi:uncharacterized protein LOC132047591 [Lycium ferocissimum]|uniref:uncharacterized protein LOC132047591 n=1 Tax=Lycium ferocissimum TaxID=112874 RepID=UPI002814A157|nr:uncharacterized protein LOC132047591 [Lycium ferocissimum]